MKRAISAKCAFVANAPISMSSGLLLQVPLLPLSLLVPLGVYSS
jgi:hypothetical protein